MRHLKLCVVIFGLVVLPQTKTSLAQHGRGGGAGHGVGAGAAGPEPHDVGAQRAGSKADHELGADTKKTPDQLLNQNTKLSSKLADLLPPGTNVQQAAVGFKNLGQFVAAVHVSHNLGIPFDQLKNRVIVSGDSLGKAIHELKPDANAKEEVKRANRESKADF